MSTEASPQRVPAEFLVQAAVAAVSVVVVAGVSPWILDLGMGGLEGKLGITVLFVFGGALVIGLAAVMGLPLRLSAAARGWWIARPAIPIIGIAIAVTAMVAFSLLMQPAALDLLRTTSLAALGFYLLLGVSWLGLEFFALHWWAPVNWYQVHQARQTPS